MLKVLSNILCDLDPTVKVIGQKAGICDGVPSTSALVYLFFSSPTLNLKNYSCKSTNKIILALGQIKNKCVSGITGLKNLGRLGTHMFLLWKKNI